MSKAQIQIHWVFVIVAGSVILLFFIGFGVKYKDLQYTKLNSEISRYIDNAIQGLKIGEQFKVIKLTEKVNIDFKCDKFVINNDYAQNWDENIVFSPDNINSEELIVWTKKVDLPFSIDKIIFISDKDHKIFLVDNEFAREIKKAIPEQFNNVELISYNDLGSISFEEFKNVKIVSFGSDLLDKYRSKADVLSIDPANFGNIKFDDQNFDFVDKSMIYGAIFASNNSYSCSRGKLFKKASLISNIYYNKALYLQDCCSNFKCNYNDITNSLQLYSDNFDSSYININNINMISNELESKNNDLFNRDCRVMF